MFAEVGQDPLLDVALKLQEVALADDYFISKKLAPNVDYYSGLIYRAMGFPLDFFPVSEPSSASSPRTTGADQLPLASRGRCSSASLEWSAGSRTGAR